MRPGDRRRGGHGRRVLVAVVLASAVGQLAVLVATGTPAARADTCPDGQWSAEFHTGTALGGDPVGQRCDSGIDFDWSQNGPGVTGIVTTNYSVRWTRQATLAAGTYTATVTGDDGVRVLIDGQTVADGWGDHGPQTFSGTRTLTAGAHTIVVEYYQGAGGAMVTFDLAGGPGEAGGPGPDCPAGQWSGLYFPNRTLSGTGVPRCSAALDDAWGDGDPGLAGIGADNFSARWTRTDTLPAGTLTLTATADDGIRVLVDGQPVINQWHDQGPTTYTATVAVAAGSHDLTVEYYEHSGGATARVTVTTTAAPTCNTLQWSAQYFPNPTLSGTPSPARCETDLRHDYGTGGPDVTGIGTDGFSARWTRVDSFAAGPIRITATADDGARVYVDGTRVIDGWNDQGPTTLTATPTLTAGPHTIVTEYYERAGGAQIRVSYTGGGDPGPVPPAPPGGCTSDCDGSWRTLDSPMPVRSVHASVLRTGNVLLVAGSGNDQVAFDTHAFRSAVWNPGTGEFQETPMAEDLFCSGHVQLPDGRILLAGGTAAYSTATSNYKGLAKSFVFDPVAGTYTATNDLPGGGHWYPSLTELGTGDVVAVGGLDENAAGNVATELFDSNRGRWLPTADVAQSYFFWGLYPELKLMTDGRLFYGGVHTFGNAPTAAGSNIYDPATATVNDVAGLRDVNLRDQGASVLLPPAQAQRVLTLGGGNGDAGADAVASTDLIDLRQADPHWQPGPDLPAAKMYVSAVILPDGTVLETGGGRHLRSDPVHEASILNPATNRFTSVPPDPQDRTYHSQAFLLPDGSVAALGNNPVDGSFSTTISVYRPWYMSRARPSITAAAETFGYGSHQALTVDGDIGRVTLLRPASVTHQADPNQRSVDLPISAGGQAGHLAVDVPSNPNLLPPGYYMMFAQNTAGVPSVARWVRVQ
ncbi:conserved exported hypothetical protein [Frankia canadensis]|uniref:PA14 domain-containing protein n=1 Tax=Frankia canadensis TaxID=1836972 RepID=A0A2I2KRT0_9ACTN|nr:PA14 domain-containing protein [Frankia canadensis]SNQ48378.1 conserved exported hypothetical protein [Frankia canadensis]SOU55668.1 conserved exported hypothetical protein [Frankia canadensis]